MAVGALTDGPANGVTIASVIVIVGVDAANGWVASVISARIVVVANTSIGSRMAVAVLTIIAFSALVSVVARVDVIEPIALTSGGIAQIEGADVVVAA